MTGENGTMYMPVAPAYGGGEGMFGGNGAWWIIILLAVLGWGNGFGFGGNGGNSIGGEVQRGFDQNAIMNGFAGVNNTLANQASAMQNCCCENRLGTADLKYTVATEAAATRANCNDNNQKILDKLCQLELDGVKQNYEGQLRALQGQLAAATAENQSLRFVASQGAQTAAILANNEAQTTALEQYLAPVPRPAYVVQNPNGCPQNYGYGGCGGLTA